MHDTAYVFRCPIYIYMQVTAHHKLPISICILEHRVIFKLLLFLLDRVNIRIPINTYDSTTMLYDPYRSITMLY